MSEPGPGRTGSPGRPVVRQLEPTRIPIQRRVTDPAADAAELQRRVSQVSRGAVRAAILGVNDGLVTNVCLILAIAGAHASAANVRLAGFASLIAGSFSMAAGEWVSVRSQCELFSGLLGELRGMVARNPKLILDELSGHLEAAGFARETAQLASTELPLDQPRFLRFTATTLFGIDPDELGSPAIAASTSLALFAVGALVPLLPWFFIEGLGAAATSVSLTAIASLAVGAAVGHSSGRSRTYGALRQLAIVAAASAVTYGIGLLFGTTVA